MPLDPSATRAKLAGVAAAAMLLAGCAGDGSMRATAEVVGLATTPQEPRTFVQQSRPVDPAYIPVGTVVTRQAKRKTVEEFKVIESALDSKRGANDAAGARAKVLGATAPAQPAVLPTN